MKELVMAMFGGMGDAMRVALDMAKDGLEYLTPAAQYVWDIYVKQQVNYGLTEIITFGLCVLMWGLFFLIMWKIANPFKYDSNYKEEIKTDARGNYIQNEQREYIKVRGEYDWGSDSVSTPWAIIWLIVLCVGMCIFFLFLFENLSTINDSIRHIINPEYYAIEELRAAINAAAQSVAK